MNKSNEDSKMIPFQLRLNNVKEFDTIKKIRSYKELGYSSQSDLLREAVLQFFNDESKADDLKEKLEEQKLIKIKNENSLSNIKKRKLEAETKITEYHADNLDVLGDKPSPQAKNAMDYHVNGKPLPHSKENMYCPDCKWYISGSNSVYYQITRLRDHVELSHKRRFTEAEERQLQELLK